MLRISSPVVYPSSFKGKSPKLNHPWHGPYRVIEVFSELNLRIRACRGKQSDEQIVHVNRLKPYKAADPADVTVVEEGTTPPKNNAAPDEKAEKEQVSAWEVDDEEGTVPQTVHDEGTEDLFEIGTVDLDI